jgi:hypothetical protein
VLHGFVRAADGTITTFDPPGSVETYAVPINNKGLVAGFYQTGDRMYHGYTRRPDGTMKTFDPPGSVDTVPQGIDNSDTDAGAITGYFSSNNLFHGFLRTR